MKDTVSMRAMILAAGYGTRLGRLTKDIPKPMLDLCGKPILEHIIRNLARQGFDQIAVNLHYKADMIKNHFGSGSRFGVGLVYSRELKLLGTAGGIKKMEWFLGTCAFLVHYGDVLTNQDFRIMLRFHRNRRALVTLLLHQRDAYSNNSVVSLDEEGRIVDFLERPVEQIKTKSPWVNSGVYICNPQLLNEIPLDTFCDFPRDIFPKLIDGNRVFGLPVSGYRYTVDSLKELTNVRNAMKKQANAIFC